MRIKGASYSEILKQVPVAKSTLSEWFKNVHLATRHRRMLSERQRQAAMRGAQARHKKKEDLLTVIKTAAKKEIKKLSHREQWFIGTALYWAEGSKEKVYNPGVGLIFNNSDPSMVRFYTQWLENICHVDKKHIKLTLYIHESKRSEIETVMNFWAHYLKRSVHDISGVYMKRSKPKTNRKNVGSLYYGTLRVTVSASSGLNRKVAGWIEGIIEAS